MAVQVAYAAAAFILSKIGGDLLTKKTQKTPLVDEKPSTTSTRGSFIPKLVGRRRIGAHIAWVGNRKVATETAAGGKGSSPSGGQQLVYREDAHHVLCVAPAQKLYTIWSNGKVVYAPSGGITNLTHPSGTSITCSLGTFVIYWGESDSPIDTYLGDVSRVGVASRWRFFARIVWKQCRLGGFPTWPAIEYEIEVRPYKAGFLVGVNYDTLPDRLNGSNGWINNEYGPDPAAIYNIIDGYNALEVPATGGNIKIAGNHTADFTAGNKALVLGQNYLPFVNSLVHVTGSNYSSGEVYYTPASETIPGSYVPDPTNAVWVKTNLTVTTSGVTPPTGSGGAQPYLFTPGIGFPSTAVWNAAHTTGGDRLLGRYRNIFRFYVRNFGIAGFTDLIVGFMPFTTGPLVEHSHIAHLKLVDGVATFINSNGAKMREILPPPDAQWRLFEVTYVAGHGVPASTTAYTNQIYIETPNSTPILAGLGWSRNNGNLSTGITTVDFQENVNNVDETTGTIQAYKAGFGPGGPNAAHVIDELMFETYPHGAGLDRSQFDISSLEAIGATLESEGLRSHVFGPDGKSYEDMLASIFLDVGMICSWDRVTNLYKFVLLRNPNLLPSIPNIPEELISDPLPEIVAVREAKTNDKVFFGFPDVALGYRDNLIVASDSGRASIDQNQKGDVVQLDTAIDTETAIKIAERRAQETLVSISKASITVLRDAGDFYPGQALTCHGFDEILRVIEVRIDPKTRRTVLDVISDSYGLEAATSLSFLTFAPTVETPPLPDDAVMIAEVPIGFRKGAARAFSALRIRANAISDAAAVWVSADDLTYTRVQEDSRYVTGGILYDAMAGTGTDIVTGPTIYALGPDMASLAQTLNADDWSLGRQLLICGDEWMFLQEVVPLGNNFYRLDGIKRGKYRTSAAAHSVGDKVFIVDPRRLDLIYDPVVENSRLVYAKAQPRSSTREVSLVDISSVNRSMSSDSPTTPILNFKETPTGTINGVNADFVLSFRPSPPESLMLFKNGLYMTLGVDYTLTTNTITFDAAQIPIAGDTITVGLYQS